MVDQFIEAHLAPKEERMDKKKSTNYSIKKRKTSLVIPDISSLLKLYP
jgi:hypothetical protein